MTVKRFVAAAFALGLGLALGSCSSFSDTVSDHWPHFAGGEPDDLPPRPGAPGYDAFIAHGQPQQGATAQPAGASETTAATNPNRNGAAQSPSAFTEQPPQAQQPGAPMAPAARPRSDPNGLY